MIEQSTMNKVIIRVVSIGRSLTQCKIVGFYSFFLSCLVDYDALNGLILIICRQRVVLVKEFLQNLIILDSS